jgi:hypothetical protein
VRDIPRSSASESAKTASDGNLTAANGSAVADARGSPIIPVVDEQRAMIEIDAGETLWRFDRTFLESNWTCIWGRGCHGIGPEKAARLNHGCCSLGAEIDGIDEELTLSATAAALRPELFQFHAEAHGGGIYRDAERTNTRLIDGACIFLNRIGFSGGEGCALHLAALAVDESPIDWKPSVCWQLPVKVDWEMRDDDVEVATVHGWTRRDWGDDGDAMAWCCTERADQGGTDEAYVGDRPVFESLADEIEAIVGTPVFIELDRRLRAR